MLKKTLIIIITFLFSLQALHAQSTGDYRSVASGNWTSVTSWQYFNGTTWVAATSYPGQNPGTGNVSIVGGYAIILNATIPNSFTSLTIGDGIFQSSNDQLTILQDATYSLNTLLVILKDDGTIYWSGNSKGALILPVNSVLRIDPGTSSPAPLSSNGCNNNQILHIGTYDYAGCTGGGNVVYIFSDINGAGGTLAINASTDASVCLGSVLNLYATASGLGSNNATITWTGIGPGGYTYSQSTVTTSTNKTDNQTISGLAPGTYTFTAKVSDNYYTPATNQQTLTIVVYPKSVSGTLSASPSMVCSGSTSTLTLSGYTGSIQWQQSADNSTWSNISGATSATYITSAITSATYYRAIVTSGECSSAISNTARVIISTPVITTQPVNTEGCAGSTVSYTVATSTPGTTYQWQVNNGSWNLCSNDGYYFSGVTTSILQISNLPTYMGAYKFRVILTNNSCSVTSNEVTLTVDSPPMVTTSYLAQTLCQNTPAAPFSISASSGSGTISSYQWYSKATNDVQSGGILIAGATSASYIPSTSTPGTLYYYCVVSNSNGCSATASSFCGHVSVSATPATPTAGNSGPICAGGMLTLSASTVSNASYTWTGPNGFISSIQNPTVSTSATAVMAGTYSVTATVNGCTSSAGTTTVTLNASVWVGTTSTAWENVTNWQSGCMPLSGADVSFDTNPVNNLILDANHTVGNLTNLSTKQLVIPAGKSLTVNGSIHTNNDPNQIYIQSSQLTSNGSLTFNNKSGSPVYATVEMYSLASWNLANPVNGKYKWQFFGIPVNSIVLSPTFDGSYVRQNNEAGNGSGYTSDKRWIQLTNTSVMTPVNGYEIVQPSAKTYYFQGQLVNSDISKSLTYTTTADYPGQQILSNPYTAAIDIAKINYSNMEESVYLYNTGSFNDWQLNTGVINPSSNPGQYVVAPKNTAGTGGIPGELPSMQGFMVVSYSGGGTLTIPYSSVITKSTDLQRARSTENSADKVYTRINVSGTRFSDQLWIFSNPNCTHNFDNGWDGYKMLGNTLAPQIFAIENDGNYQVDAVDNADQTSLGFIAGEDSIYTLTFVHQNLSDQYSSLYIVDSQEKKTVDVTQNGSTYTFNAPMYSSDYNRFKISSTSSISTALPTTANEISDVKVFVSGQMLHVVNTSGDSGVVTLIDMMGRIVQKIRYNANGETIVAINLHPGTYLAKAYTAKKSFVLSLLVSGK